jgi:hypothetical protein
MAFTLYQRHHLRLVDLGISLTETMGIEGLLTLPVLHEGEPTHVRRGMVGVKPQAAWLLTAQLHGLLQQAADRVDICSILSGQEDIQTEHGEPLITGNIEHG